LQVALAPAAVTPLPTLWFVGMVLPFYLIYRLAVAPRTDARSMALAAAAALIPLVAARVVLGAPEVRFFLYYFVFMAGVVVRQTGLLDSLRTKGASVIVASAVVSLGAFIAAGGPAVDEGPALSSSGTVALMAMINVMIVSWALLAWLAARQAAPRLGPRAAGLFAACSAASYFVYLFHRPALVLATSVLERAGVAWPLQLLAVLAAVLPALFLAGRAVQRPMDLAAGRVLERVRRSAPR
jgi:peptidoglycan/LPS O-acetylase OafA/YrhL